ncbi:MAG: riboflavin synthase [Candidatus Hydrogenedentes bacterium]|nr:riboflavin synthase [Candidatus Hydrogenedentota bacterium]
MFTGLIEEVGVVSRRSGADVTILAQTVLDSMKEGDSIAVNGVCLTVVAFDESGFVVQMSPETLEKSSLRALQAGDAVNLERAMALGDRMGGHFVQGHVDGVGRVKSITNQGDFSFWKFQAPSEVAKYLVPKGSISIDGISLTIVDPSGDTFGVALIPTTLNSTTLGKKRPGDLVNMEADLFAKHIYHYLRNVPRSGLSLETLQRQGYLEK